MMLTAHQEQVEAARESRRERAKAIVRLEMLIIRSWEDGLNEEQTDAFLRAHRAEFAVPPGVKPIGRSRVSLWRLRVHLELVSARGNNQHQTHLRGAGRRDRKATLLEVQP